MLTRPHPLCGLHTQASLRLPVVTMTTVVRRCAGRFAASALAILFVLAFDRTPAAAARPSTPPSGDVADTTVNSAAGSIVFGLSIVAVLILATLVIGKARKHRSW